MYTIQIGGPARWFRDADESPIADMQYDYKVCTMPSQNDFPKAETSSVA